MTKEQLNYASGLFSILRHCNNTSISDVFEAGVRFGLDMAGKEVTNEMIRSYFKPNRFGEKP